MAELGARINHTAGQGMSSWAKKLLERQGAWVGLDWWLGFGGGGDWSIGCFTRVAA